MMFVAFSIRNVKLQIFRNQRDTNPSSLKSIMTIAVIYPMKFVYSYLPSIMLAIL